MTDGHPQADMIKEVEEENQKRVSQARARGAYCVVCVHVLLHPSALTASFRLPHLPPLILSPFTVQNSSACGDDRRHEAY